MNEHELNPKFIKNIGLTFFIILFLGLSSFIFFTAKAYLGRYYPIRVRFNFIADLRQGSTVKFIGGPDIGYVKKIYRYKNKIEILLYLRKSFKLREKAEISLFSHGMMGERYIEISQTAYSGNYVQPGTLLIGNDAVSFEIFQSILSKFTKDLFSSEEKENTPPRPFDEIINDISKNLQQHSYTIYNIRPTAKNNINKFQSNVDNISEKIEQAQDFIIKLKKDLESVSKQDIQRLFSTLYELENSINSFNQSIPKLMKTTKEFRKKTKEIAEGKTMVGQLIFDKKQYNNILDTIEDLEDYSEDIVDNPRNLLFK